MFIYYIKQILYQHKTTSSGPSAAPSTAAAPPYITVLPNTQTAGPSGAPAMIRAAPEQQLVSYLTVSAATATTGSQTPAAPGQQLVSLFAKKFFFYF